MLNDSYGFKKVYIATGYTDLRRGMEGLAGIIRFQFDLDPYDKNTLFLFCGRRSNRIKGLLWEGDGNIIFFNEAEAVSDLDAEEPESLEVKPARKPKSVGKKEADISGLPVNIITHYMSEDELNVEFGKNGWKQLPDAIAKRYRFIPAKVEVDEHHVGVYVGKNDGRIIKAPHPPALLHGSLVSPTIAAAIINGKYVNAVPLYRLE